MEDGFSRRELELRLAPPGDQEGCDYDPSLLSLGNSYSSCAGSKRVLEKSWLNENHTHKLASCSSQYYYHQQQEEDLIPVMGKEPSQKRTAAAPAPAPVVGWPPIRSFRKNIASSNSSKLKVEPKQQNVAPAQKSASGKQVENCCKGLFVKINMDGVPIGRKVDLKAYDSYEKLSCSVDELFRGLLAAQREPSNDKIMNSDERDKLITGLLDGRGEYTLVYEDNEGDRMLVGDVPWHMFVQTVKRLRVLKSSELSSLFSGSREEEPG